MINLEDVEKTILELEQRDTTYTVCERLAWLYIVRDHLKTSTNSLKDARIAVSAADSEFLSAVADKNISDVLNVLNEHLEAVRVLYSKEYEAVINMIKAL